MQTTHLEVLVEEPSMEAFLAALLARMLGPERTFAVHPFQGKADLLAHLEDRLKGYAAWLPETSRIIVIVDRDDDDGRELKARMERSAQRAGLRSCTRAHGASWQIVNRIAIEELEAWYFGDWDAVRAAYPKVSATVPNRAGFRDPDAIRGGTWEAFERVMRRHGYFKCGLAKTSAARAIGKYIDPQRSRSHSFGVFCGAVLETMA